MRGLKITQSITNRQDASLGLYFKDVSKQSLLTPKEEEDLTRRIKEGDKKAVEELIKANLRFVISVAKQYQNRGLPLVDLIQEGNVGLVSSVQKFDPSKGFRFISYAVWWIRQAIIKALADQGRTVRIPMNQVVCMNKINKATAAFEQEHGRKPSAAELEENTSINQDRINFTLSSSNRSVSLDTPIREEDASSLLDVIPNENSEPVEDSLDKSDLTNSIESVLHKLPYRESDILRMSFGIGIPSMPHEEIAKRFGVGSERVRQVLHIALDRIRKNYSNDLKELL